MRTTVFRPQRTVVLIGVTFGLLFSLAACGMSSETPLLQPHPSDQDARNFLARVVADAATQDIPTLCKIGSLNCLRLAQDSHAAERKPQTPPTVVGTSDVPDAQHEGGGVDQGGRLLEVCGLDGQGKQYRSRLLFFGSDVDHFTVFEPIFWVGTNVQASSAAYSTTSVGAEWDMCPTPQ
jgi:hypothetical protein